MSETPAPISHVRFIVGCVTVLALFSAGAGAWLLWKGFAGGELLCSQVGVAIGGLLAMLSQRPQSPSAPTAAQVGTPSVTAAPNTTVTTS
jgi:hypothetical protein